MVSREDISEELYQAGLRMFPDVDEERRIKYIMAIETLADPKIREGIKLLVDPKNGEAIKSLVEAVKEKHKYDEYAKKNKISKMKWEWLCWPMFLCGKGLRPYPIIEYHHLLILPEDIERVVDYKP